MKLAILQPYIFPYLGYFQLIHAVDRFVVLDDVQYIVRGWINRNQLLVKGQPHFFTVPLSKAGRSKLISDINVVVEPAWRKQLLKTIECSYSRAPHYSSVAPLLRDLILTPERNLSDFAQAALRGICEYLEIQTQWVPSSSKYANRELQAQERIIDICRQEQASEYLNPQGGIKLYNCDDFSRRDVTLRFLKPAAISYPQFGNTFCPKLSIIDVLMFNSKQEVQSYLDCFELV